MYKIGSFNCLNFGMGASKDVRKFADIIWGEGFDIIALQEIKGQSALDRILNVLPQYWKGVADSSVNDYAFLWNTRRIELANAYEMGIDRKYEPRIYKQYRVDKKIGQKDLVREPYFARFFPVGGNAPYIEIRLINTHIRFKKGVNDDENSLGAIAMRRNEFDILTKAIYAKEADKRYGNNRPAYTILLGDYNLNLPSSSAKAPYLVETFVVADGKSIKKITTLQNGLSTLSQIAGDSNPEGSGFANNYDHFTIDEMRFGNIGFGCNPVDTVEKYYEGNLERHMKDISDHVPVEMRLNLRG